MAVTDILETNNSSKASKKKQEQDEELEQILRELDKKSMLSYL